MARKYKCCICGGVSEGYGNDPWPVVSSDECCDRCNCTVVLKARYDYGKKQKLTMKKMIGRLAAWLRGIRMRAIERRKAAAECRMVMDARRTVQVREFKGEVWVCFGEVPVLPVEGLKWDLPTTLDVARDACLKHWKEERGHER